MALPIAELVVKLRTARAALPYLPTFAQDAQAQAFDRVLKRRWLPIAARLGAGMDVLAALAGTDKYGLHSYTEVYERFMHARRRDPVTLLEIGVGGYADWPGGESLLMWAAYFPRAKIYGIDLVDKTALSSGRIEVFECSQVDREKLTALARRIGPFDFVIDDGSHRNADQIETFRILWPFVKDGGIYVVEDVQTSYWPWFGGGVLESPGYERSCMAFFKGLADSVNAAEFLAQPGPGARVEQGVGSIAFHHSLVVVTKDVGERTSSLPLHHEDVRAALMRPEGSGL